MNSVAPTAILPPRPAPAPAPPVDPEALRRASVRARRARRLAAELIDLARHQPADSGAETLLDRALDEVEHQIGVAALNLGLTRTGG